MFTWLNKQGVQSDRGFVVQVTGRFTIEYREGEQTIAVPVEFSVSQGGTCVIIDPHAFHRWDNDTSGLMIPLEKQREILANFKEAMEFQNVPVLVEAPEP